MELQLFDVPVRASVAAARSPILCEEDVNDLVILGDRPIPAERRIAVDHITAADRRGSTLPGTLGAIGGSSMRRGPKSPGVGSIYSPVPHTRSRPRRLSTRGCSDELLPTCHVTERDANDPIEAGHSQLKAGSDRCVGQTALPGPSDKRWSCIRRNSRRGITNSAWTPIHDIRSRRSQLFDCGVAAGCKTEGC